MDKKNIRELLVRLAAGAATVDEVMEELREEPFRDLGFAKIDSHRSLRQGIAEVIYGAGKRPEQIAEIAKLDGGQKTVLITRMGVEAARAVALSVPLAYHEIGRVGIAGEMPEPDGRGTIVVATGGTSDMPVAEEAALTAEALGNKVTRSATKSRASTTSASLGCTACSRTQTT